MEIHFLKSYASLLRKLFIVSASVDDCLKDMSHPSDNSDLFLLWFLYSSMQKREQLINDHLRKRLFIEPKEIPS